ncbi:ATP-binding cassette domain-containing protein [Candidatus Puniceispirillum marinum]|uniref:ATPase n=1 Tax=Puniceispirillum marinum (strain IMCC1322) TaxID=488538 RepID=D5BT14_PUNMI|nr:ATP-binding cassette domain-containing protein [Candidatus Puniceispirillum marinum]ADE39411.1 ATPase [Candidatus Puniceispirillum marinum IMCC1322]
MLKPMAVGNDHWFFGPVLSCKSVYVQVIFGSVLINIFALASSLYIMTIYDRVVPNNAIHSMWWLTAIIVVVIFFDLAMKILRGVFVDTAGARVDKQVSTALFDRISRHDANLSRTATGSLAGTVRNFDILKEVIGSASFTVFADLPFIFLFLVVLYLIGGPVAAVPAVIVPLVILFAFLLQPIIRRMTELSQSQGKSKQAVMVEMISALETVKTTQGISMLRNRWLNSVLHQSKSSTKTKITSQLAAQFAQFGQQVSQIGIVVYGVFLIADGNLTMGQLIACVILSGRTMAPLGQITGLLGKMNSAFAAYKSLDEILGTQSEEEAAAAQVERQVIKGDISFKNVSFTYEDQPEPVLTDISFDIKAGQRMAIVGRIGSGKTTLLRLLCGLNPPDRGAVLIDNADIRQIRPDDVRRNIGVVLQNPVLFSGSIRDNILMGNPSASDEDLIEAARLSGAEAFIGMLPGGFDFPMSERGRELSVGMRQSVAIARALIGKPNILLMDEPTAPLDSSAEQQMVEHLDTATKGITTIFVTHRGAMLQLADTVLALEKGRIAAFGPKDDVLAASNKGA